jgi:hypothetical protein
MTSPSPNSRVARKIVCPILSPATRFKSGIVLNRLQLDRYNNSHGINTEG